MTAILMRRTVSGLSPDDDAATAVLRRIKPGETVEPGDEQFDAKRHVSHFSDCPNADQHRRRA